MTDSELLGDSSFLVAGSVVAIGCRPVGTVVKSDSTVVQFPGGGRHLDEEGFVRAVHCRSRRRRRRRAPSVSRCRPRRWTRWSTMPAGEHLPRPHRAAEQQLRLQPRELGQTIDRLRSQLRDLELETEAQILSRHEREVNRGRFRSSGTRPLFDHPAVVARTVSGTVEDLSNLGQSLE